MRGILGMKGEGQLSAAMVEINEVRGSSADESYG